MNRFACHTLDRHPQGGVVLAALEAALASVDPYQAVKAHVRRAGERLEIGDAVYDLSAIRRVRVVGAGKAAGGMLQALDDILHDRLDGGAVIAKHAGGADVRIGQVEVLEGSHPLPTEKSVLATRRLMEWLRDGDRRDLVIVLISGGGSALMTNPVEGVTLAEMQELTRALLACGAAIHEINALRKHLDQIKGGGLARLAAPARVASLILSDVVGNPLDVIASGPTVPDPSTFADAWRIVERYRLAERIPAGVRAALEAGRDGRLPESLKPGDPIFRGVQHVLVGSNPQAARAAQEALRARGIQPLLLTTYLQGEARSAGQFLAAIARQSAASGDPLPRPACLIAGGETTVTLQGQGRGGRNQELALGAVADLAGLADTLLVTLATDGEDGPTDAAGAVVSGETLERARRLDLNPDEYLRQNNAYAFFESLGDLLRPGPTGTNVNDLAFLFLF
jgi:hydroxypyruvate reductase